MPGKPVLFPSSSRSRRQVGPCLDTACHTYKAGSLPAGSGRAAVLCQGQDRGVVNRLQRSRAIGVGGQGAEFRVCFNQGVLP